ncbi:MAG: FAD-dependent oxidoreductase, partial [Candidatus Eremiobacteraeota bacterium]|nr:FAD-dependent oxidoreductase [Candidatus Eremiobacteraeota bacterium]
MAREYGAVLRAGAAAVSIREGRGEYEVVCGGRHFRAGKLVIAAGPWSAPVLQAFDVRLPLEVTKEQVMYFEPHDPAPFAFGRFPVWIWMDDPSFYGFPVFGEPGAVKITQDAGGKPVDPDTRTFEEDASITGRVTEFVARRLPSALGRLRTLRTCLYTLTPDRDFVIDRLAEHPGVCVAIGAGHAFKFASLIGRILSELTLDETTLCEIGEFSIDRPVLRMQSPPKTYMV